MPVAKICEHCKISFSVPNRRHEAVKFCSRTCKAEAGWLHLKCPVCSTDFKRKKSDNSTSEVKYCSASCYRSTISGRANKIPVDAPRYYKVCEVCGKDFRVTETRKDSARWCSRGCQKSSPTFKAECSELQQKEKSWRWAGGEYQSKTGYVRSKSRVNGIDSVMLSHRQVVLAKILDCDPDHSFIVTVDGAKKIDPQIEVHHIDRNRANNDPSNLLAVTKFAHSQIHHRNKKPNPWECWPSNPEKW